MMMGLSYQRRMRHRRFALLAAVHAGPLGPSLIGRSELGPLYKQAYAHCPGHARLACAKVGGVPQVCFVRKLERLSASALRGGRKQRTKEAELIQGELLYCLEAFTEAFGTPFGPVIDYTRQIFENDLRLLHGDPENSIATTR